MEVAVAMDDSHSNREQLWPMGAVTLRTGIGEHTLRAWERRFGFPVPVRLASAHRRYPLEQVRRLVLINAALGCGYRAGDVVPLPSGRHERLLRECGALGHVEPTPSPPRARPGSGCGSAAPVPGCSACCLRALDP